MTQMLIGGPFRMFRLTTEPGGLGLSCTPEGVSLAGVPLLLKTHEGYAPRPASEIASLLKTAYGDGPNGAPIKTWRDRASAQQWRFRHGHD